MSMQIYADKPYAVLELPIENELESTVYVVPACTWLEDITIKVSAKDGKQVTFAALCKWLPHELKLSDHLEKRKKPIVNWITYENVKILKFCKSIRQAKEEVEKALNISDLSQSDKDRNIKRQRIVTRRYSPPLTVTSMNRRKRTIYSSDSDSDIELQAPIVKGLKINANKEKTSYIFTS
ncbi:uncharacterized protein LOC112589428 [Harpegnathos saltator]|uniref:uncharacterized protein LOC112589428 n=1 Tax=Harpegnathos saltator TaxID=610380 RepID=UPI000DBEE154|nr:uncharacterized protein LOC112589428 [Harpegnathos saltator]